MECVTSAGYGSNISIILNWKLPGSITTYTVVSVPVLHYPAPLLITGTLRLNDAGEPITDTVEGNAVLLLPSTGDSFWVTFNGENFGYFPEQVTISYSNINTNGK